MMSVEMGGGGGGGGGGGSIDPSNLHLKKELTQIRKAAARVLRDPGTTSSSLRRSPLNSTRSTTTTKHHYVHHHNKIDGNAVVLPSSSSDQFPQLPLQVEKISTSNKLDSNQNPNPNSNSKEKKVFLYNWRSHKSESERSKHIDEEEEDEEGSISSVDSDARNGGGGNDSKSDIYPSAMFKCRNTDFTPSIMRTIKKKPRRSNYSNATLRHHNEKLQKQIIVSRYAHNVVDGLPGLGLRRGDSVNLAGQSDDTEDYCNSTVSPLLARIKNNGWAPVVNRKKNVEDDSVSYSTPALSTSSRNNNNNNNNNKYGIRNPSTVESWDATTGSCADDEVDDNLDLPGRNGCGIPCYWSRRSTPKSRVGSWSCYSPSLSDTLRRKSSSIFCGTHSTTHQRRHHNKRKPNSSHVPLLTNSSNSDDELSTNYGEIDLEALSRLDGKRWSSSCRSQEGLEIVAMNDEVQDESSPENVRSLSHKYRPMFFEELIGQNIVVQSLINTISRGRISPVYLFQGPRGTGKTSAARIFAAALNCLASNETKPCGVCRECSDFMSGKSRNLLEADGSSKKGIENIKSLLKSHLSSSSDSKFRVFVVEECHLLPSKTWLTFLRLLEKPTSRVVFVLVTTDADNVPRAILSRCQKHLFNKIGNSEIVGRLRKIVSDENLDVELDALEMIASNADGSLRDAETTVDQLSLFGKRITVSLVNELIGVVSDEKLLELLELAMASNATETVIRARELMDCGVDPIVLMSQMATLIVDIIAGTYPSSDGKHDSFFGGRNLSERELDRLKHALNLLSEAEKHLRVSSERSTWFTATLLQLGSVPSPDRTHSGSSRRQSSKTTEEDHIIMLRETMAHKQRSTADAELAPERSNSPVVPYPHRSSATRKDDPAPLADSASFDSDKTRCMNSKMLINVWIQCIEKCHSKTLRQLLHSHGRLVSVSEVKGGFVAHIAFSDKNIKTRAEGFLSSITNSFEIVLRHNVEVKIILLPDSLLKPNHHHDDVSENANVSTSKGGSRLANIPPAKRIESIIHEQRLETAWLQAMEKGGTPGSKRNQILPQDGSYYPSKEFDGSVNSADVAPLQQWEDELNREIKALKINDRITPQKDQIIAKRSADHFPMSPSLLHNSSFASNFSKDNIGYESGSGAAGCSGLFCWNNSKPHKRAKAKQGTPLRARKSGRFSWFGECAKSRRTDSKYSR
ncbi:hypothetical protein ACP275_14G090200 [Erythranthe tilingii]